jgi:AcrR family transcriptional regulator
MMFSDDTRGRLLRAAAIAVARHGTRTCTVQHILDEAELSRRTFYKAFSGLEDALNTLYEVSVDVLNQTITRAVQREGSTFDRIMAAIDSFLELQLVGGPLIIALQREAMHNDSRLSLHRHRLVDSFVELIERELQSAERALTVSTETARGVILAIEGLVHHAERNGSFDECDRQRIRRSAVELIERVFGLDSSS